MGEAVFAQLDPLPTDLEGYQRFWAAQQRRDPGASRLGNPITLAEAQSSPPAVPLTTATGSPAASGSDPGASGSLPPSTP
ncbi:hypothetical protein, partial [Synechococcus sp. H55.11]